VLNCLFRSCGDLKLGTWLLSYSVQVLRYENIKFFTSSVVEGVVKVITNAQYIIYNTFSPQVSALENNLHTSEFKACAATGFLGGDIGSM
jgi:hypothetical protein